MVNKLSFPLLVFILIFYSCKEENRLSEAQKEALINIDNCVERSEFIKTLLEKKADSLKSINEFEALKYTNSLNMLNENLVDLKLYQDTLKNHLAEVNSPDNFLVIASTQAEYVNGLVTAGKALLNNQSFSIGQWRDGTPKAIHDSITTPIKKK